MYLSRVANRATLRAIASAASAGSQLVFASMDQARFDAPPDDLPEAERTLRQAVAAAVGLVPPVLQFLAMHPRVDPYDLSSLESISRGAAPGSKEVAGSPATFAASQCASSSAPNISRGRQ